MNMSPHSLKKKCGFNYRPAQHRTLVLGDESGSSGHWGGSGNDGVGLASISTVDESKLIF